MRAWFTNDIGKIARALVASVLVASVGMKLALPVSGDYSVGPFVVSSVGGAGKYIYWFAIGVEASLVLGLMISRCRQIALGGVAVLAVASIAQSLWSMNANEPSAACGCFGSFEVGRGTKLMIGGAFLLLVAASIPVVRTPAVVATGGDRGSATSMGGRDTRTRRS